MKKYLLVIIFSSILLGSLIGGALNSPVALAGFWSDLLEKYVPKIFIQQDQSSDSNKTSVNSVVPYAPTIDYEQAVVKAVEDASPSVVSIVISKYLPIIEQCPYDPFEDLPPSFRQFFGNDLEYSRPCETGTKLEKVGGGSGFVISSDGIILTNKHVVLDTKAEYTVVTHDGKKYDAKVLARDPIQDLALIKVEAGDLKPAKLGDSDSIKLGQTAIAIGYSLGEFSNTVSVGVISGLSRTITASGAGIGTETIQGVIQTDAAINPGNSGGPLLNLRGEVIGVNTAVASDAENIGFAIPVNQAKRDIESVKATGTIKIPYLGVQYEIITPDTSGFNNLPVKEGALIKSNDGKNAVLSNSPAAKAGIKAGDIIIEVNGEKIGTDKNLGTLIQKYNIGEIITVKIRRGTETLELKATLEERP